MRVLVTGADGFVGTRLVQRLRKEGWEVVGIDRETDVTDAAAVERAVELAAPDAVAHLAALSFVPQTVREPWAAYRVNFLGTRNVLSAVAMRAPRARTLVVSTGHVYGTSSLDAPAFDERSPLRPDSPYARTKACADLLAQTWEDRGLDIVRARPFNHTGRGRPDWFVESSFARQLARIEAGRQPPRLEVGNLDSVRDFLHVDDVVDAYARLLPPGGPTGACNIASGEGRSIRDVLSVLRAWSRAPDPEITVDPARVRPTDRAVGDPTRLRETTGWRPQHGFEATMRELLEGWRASDG